MKAEKRLDVAVFQLTPTRTRCELVISAQGETEKLASGLLKPFLTHLKTAEEQVAKGGYSIRLEPLAGTNQHVTWFTKGTIERFVRFVSTPEVLERVNTIETEIIQIEEAISIQGSEALVTQEQPSKSNSAEQKEASRPIIDENSESAIVPYKSRRHSVDGNDPGHGGNSKACLLKVLETRKIVLQKEQGMAFARAAAAGFDMEHMHDLVSFADCFGAFRLREACINFINLWKKKQEAGLWFEEMELETLEASSTRSEMALMNASGIILTSDSVFRRLKPKEFTDGWSDIPSEVGDSKVSSHNNMSRHGMSNAAETTSDVNGDHHNGENRLSMEGQVSPALAGSNDYPQGHSQQPMMPVWPGQALQHMQNFQSHGAGPGPIMQGLPGFPMHGTPYYHGYSPNPPFYQGIYPQAQTDDHRGLAMPPPHSFPHWPQYAEDPRFGTAQRTESHTMTNISPDMKSNAVDERDTNIKSETSETGSPKCLSRSLVLADQDTESEPEKEYMLDQGSHRHLQGRSTSPRRRSSSPHRKVQIGRTGNKRSGMVVIRNINYITSKRPDRIGKEENSENSNSAMDSDVENDLKQQAEDVQLHVQDVIDLFEKKRKESAESKLKKADRRHSVDSFNSGDNKGKSARNDIGTEADRKDVENESWSVFQKYLLRDDESSQNNSDKVDKVDQGSKGNVEDMIVVDRGNLDSEGWEKYHSVPLEQELVSKKKEHGISKDSLVLPERHGEDALLNSRGIAESEGSSTCKKSMAYDDFIISREEEQTTSHGAGSDPFAGGEVDRTTNQRSDYLCAEKSYGQSIGDDSFMVSTRSMSHYQTGNEWRTVMNIDSELPSTTMVKKYSNGLQKNQYEFTDGYEHDDLYMMPERISERESLGLVWDPAMDYELQANVADKVHPDTNLNVSLNEIKSPEEKADSKMKEHLKMKKSEKDLRLKAMQEALEKRKAEMAARNARPGKPSPLAEAQMRAEKLRAFKASLQKTKKEREEEERNRLEELKIQRQRRIAARRSSSPTSSSSTSRTTKSQKLKAGPASKLLSPSSHKGRTSRTLSPGGSFPSPSGSRSITRSSSEITNDMRSRKQNLSSHTKSAGTALSRSVPSLSELKKEQGGTFQASRRLSATKKSSDQIVSSKSGKEAGNIKPIGVTSHSTGHASDNLDPKKYHLPATRKSTVTGSEPKDRSSKGSSDLDTSSQKSAKHNSMHANQRERVSILAADVGSMKPKGNTPTDFSNKYNDDVVLQDEKVPKYGEPDSLSGLRAEVSVELIDQENGSDNKSELKVGVDPFRIHVPASTNAGDITSQNPSESLSDSCTAMQSEAVFVRAQIILDEENDTEKVCQSEQVPINSFGVHSSTYSAQTEAREDEENVLQASSSILQRSHNDEPYQAPLARMTSFDNTSYDNFSTYDAPLAPETTSGPLGIFVPRAPVSENNSHLAVTSDFPNSSPLLQNMPKLPQSISPAADRGKSDISHSRQKGSSGEKLKENAKGFKRLLKFGRKGHHSSTSESYEDVYRLQEMGSRSPEDKSGRLEATKDSGNVKSQLSGITMGATSDNDISSQVHSLGSLISQDDNSPVINTHKASRSFFSLSSFRSKGSETKSR